jgi:hypothetical protein
MPELHRQNTHKSGSNLRGNTLHLERCVVFTAVTMNNDVFCDVALVRPDVSEECIAFIIRVERISELGTLAVTSNYPLILSALMMETILSSETGFLQKPLGVIFHKRHSSQYVSTT